MRAMSFTLAAAVLVLGACRETSAPDGASVTLTVGATSFRAGTATDLTVTVANGGERPLLAEAHPCTPFVVTTTTGRVVGPRVRLCDAVAHPPLEIAPGAQHMYPDGWAGDALTGSSQTLILLPPGDYLLRARVFAGGRVRESEPVLVTLTP